jgi:AraC-like DNA-binding protein
VLEALNNDILVLHDRLHDEIQHRSIDGDMPSKAEEIISIAQAIRQIAEWRISNGSAEEDPAQEAAEATETAESVEEAAADDAGGANEAVSAAKPDDRDAAIREGFKLLKEQAAKADAAKSSKKIDCGEIMALYNAGWSVPKIADEMGISKSYTYKIIKEEGVS